MTGTISRHLIRHPGFPRDSRLSATILTILLLVPIALLTSGCQEDSGQFKAASANAGPISQSRLNNALSSLQNTLGQQQPKEVVDRPTLRWEAPATREDGSRLYVSDIKEYRIYYRLKHQTEFTTISRPVSQGTAFTLDQFEPGTYLFSVTAIDSQGRESRRSDGVNVNLI